MVLIALVADQHLSGASVASNGWVQVVFGIHARPASAVPPPSLDDGNWAPKSTAEVGVDSRAHGLKPGLGQLTAGKPALELRA